MIQPKQQKPITGISQIPHLIEHMPVNGPCLEQKDVLECPRRLIYYVLANGNKNLKQETIIFINDKHTQPKKYVLASCYLVGFQFAIN